MNDQQLQAARNDMIRWLSHPHELAKKPARIDHTEMFEYNNLRFYIFRYKTTLLGNWLLGVSGGFEGDHLSPCGHTFSEMAPYDVSTARNESIRMVNSIMEYWKEQARKCQEQE